MDNHLKDIRAQMLEIQRMVLTVMMHSQEKEVVLQELGAARLALDVYMDGQRSPMMDLGTVWEHVKSRGIAVPEKAIRGYPKATIMTD